MEQRNLEDLSYIELRKYYEKYLESKNLSKSTIETSKTDAFYLWRKGGKELFWTVVISVNFEELAFNEIHNLLLKNSNGNITSLQTNYVSHLRRFRHFLNNSTNNEQYHSNQKYQAVKTKKNKKVKTVVVPKPSIEQVEYYLNKWNSLENYRLQEDALNKLFFELCTKNTDMSDILIKASTLNNFYSTNIFSIFPVAEHILSLNIDSRLEIGDETLVNDIQHITINKVEKNFYSFATKYCSHHNPLEFPIYDSYVDKILCYFRDHDQFPLSHNINFKNYTEFKSILLNFRHHYGLDVFNLKQIDQYLWQLGKDYFPKIYKRKKPKSKNGI